MGASNYLHVFVKKNKKRINTFSILILVSLYNPYPEGLDGVYRLEINGLIFND